MSGDHFIKKPYALQFIFTKYLFREDFVSLGAQSVLVAIIYDQRDSHPTWFIRCEKAPVESNITWGED